MGLFALGLASHNVRISVLGGSCIWLGVQALTSNSKISEQGSVFALWLACQNVRIPVLGGSCIWLGVQALTASEGAHLRCSF